MPLSSAPRDRLREIIAGDRTLLGDYRKLGEQLEKLGDGYAPEAFVLASTLKAGLPEDLLKADQQFSKDARLIRLGKRMMDDLCLDSEAAWWAVETWALALNTATPGELQAIRSRFFTVGYVRDDLGEGPRVKLHEAISKSSVLIESPKKLRAVLLDLCGDCPSEVFVITSSLADGLPGELLRPISTEKEVRFAELQQRLKNRLRLNDQAAMWAVLTWAYAMGIIGDKDLGRPEAIKPPAGDATRSHPLREPAKRPGSQASPANRKIPSKLIVFGVPLAILSVAAVMGVILFIVVMGVLVLSSDSYDNTPSPTYQIRPTVHATPIPTEQYGDLSGRVYYNNGVAAHATVSYSQHGYTPGSVTADEYGRYSVSNLRYGTYDFTIWDSSGNSIIAQKQVTIKSPVTVVDFNAP